MFPTREWAQTVDQTTATPLCPNCGRAMHLDRIVLRTGGLSDLTFKCGACWVIELETTGSRRIAGGAAG